MLKLPTHNRYDYSCIEKRRDYSWPDGKRLAFYVALNVEEFAFMAGRGNDPYLRTHSPQTQRNYAWRDYGLRVGIWRIFRALDELKLPATILLNSLVGDNYPDVVERIKQRGDDVCNHGRTNAERLGDLWEHDEARIIAESTETLTKHFGVRPTGWMGPGAAESRVTSDLLKEAGYTHNLGWPVDDQPIWMRTRWSTSVAAVSDGIERHGGQCTARSYWAGFRRYDRRSIRGDAGKFNRTAIGHGGRLAHVHLWSAIPHAAVAKGTETLRPASASESRLVYASCRYRQLLL
jgi:Polysaccharide deacetylase